MTAGGRVAYLAVTALLAGAAAGWAALAGRPPVSIGAGAGLAWALQAAVAGTLPVRPPGRGPVDHDRVMRRWVSGPLVRLVGLGVLAALAPAVGLQRGPALVTYCGAMVAFLLLEAAWLSWPAFRAP